MIGQQLRAADEYFPFINATFAQPHALCKACSGSGAAEIVNNSFARRSAGCAAEAHSGAEPGRSGGVGFGSSQHILSGKVMTPDGWG
jgi:hypothetical protein